MKDTTTTNPSTSADNHAEVNSIHSTATTDKEFNLENLLRISEIAPSFRNFLSQLTSESEFLAHVNDHVVHINAAERAYWNSVEGLSKQYTQNSFKTIVGYNPNKDDVGLNRTFFKRYLDDMQALRAAIAANTQANQGNLQALRSEIQSEIANVQSEIQALKSEMQSNSASIQSEIQALKSEIESEIQALKSEIESEIQSEIANVQSEIQTLKSEIGSEMQSNSASTQSDIQALKSKIESDIQALKSKIESEMQSDIQALKSKIESEIQALKSEIGSDMQSNSASTQSDIQALKSKIESEIQSDIQALKSKIESEIQSVQDDVGKFSTTSAIGLERLKILHTHDISMLQDKINTQTTQINQNIDNLKSSLSKIAYTGRATDTVDYNNLINKYIIHANRSDTSNMTYNIPQGNQGGNIWID